jgi:hypothetical protein
MLGLYGTNISYGTLFPGLDGLARSMGYESEHNGYTSANAADDQLRSPTTS